MTRCCDEKILISIYHKYPELKGDLIVTFKANPGFDGVKHEYEGKYYTFYENKTTDAPDALAIHKTIRVVAKEETKEAVVEKPTEFHTANKLEKKEMPE